MRIRLLTLIVEKLDFAILGSGNIRLGHCSVGGSSGFAGQKKARNTKNHHHSGTADQLLGNATFRAAFNRLVGAAIRSLLVAAHGEGSINSFQY